jgi:hypothetical protein
LTANEVVSGTNLPVLSTTINLDTLSSKTSPTCEKEVSESSFDNLPATGTMRIGQPSGDLMSERHMSVQDYGLSLPDNGHLLNVLLTAIRAPTAKNPSVEIARNIIQTALALGHIQKMTNGNYASKIGALLPTLTAQDAKNNGGPAQFRRNTLPLNALLGGPLNPEYAEWLMGFPRGWTDLGH